MSAEIFEWSNSGIPDSVRSRIADFVRPNSEYLKIGKPEIRVVSGDSGKLEAYAITVRKNVPDAYFDAHGNFLFSVNGVLSFEWGPDKSPAARDSYRLAGFSETKSKEGKRTWYRDLSAAHDPDGRNSGREEIDPFGREAFVRIRNVSFQQDRIDVFRRVRSRSENPSVSVAPYSSQDIREFVKAASVTALDFSKMRKLWLVDEKTYAEHKAEIAKQLPFQLLDVRFAATVDFRTSSWGVAEIRPGWHGIGANEVAALRQEGTIDAATHKAALESLELLRKRARDFGLVTEESHSKLADLKSKVR